MKKLILFIVLFSTFVTLSFAQNQIEVETGNTNLLILEGYNDNPAFASGVGLWNDDNKRSSFSTSGSLSNSQLWIQAPLETIKWFTNNAIQSMALLPNGVGNQSGLVIGNTAISAGVTIDAVQNLLPPLENGVIVGTYQGPASDHAGVLGVNRLQTSSGVGIKGKGGKVGAYGESIVGNTGNAMYWGLYGASSTNGTGTAYAIQGDGDSYFDGDITVTGNVIIPSDKRLKKNIHKSSINSLAKILALQIYTYEYDQKSYSQMRLPSGPQTGPLAQDVKELFPELVKKTVFKKNDDVSTLEQISLENQLNQLRKNRDIVTDSLLELQSAEKPENHVFAISNNEILKSFDNDIKKAEMQLKSLLQQKVVTDKVVYEGVNYIGLIPHTIDAIQQLSNENDALKNKVAILEENLREVLSLLDSKK